MSTHEQWKLSIDPILPVHKTLLRGSPSVKGARVLWSMPWNWQTKYLERNLLGRKTFSGYERHKPCIWSKPSNQIQRNSSSEDAFDISHWFNVKLLSKNLPLWHVSLRRLISGLVLWFLFRLGGNQQWARWSLLKNHLRGFQVHPVLTGNLGFFRAHLVR